MGVIRLDSQADVMCACATAYMQQRATQLDSSIPHRKIMNSTAECGEKMLCRRYALLQCPPARARRNPYHLQALEAIGLAGMLQFDAFTLQFCSASPKGP